MALQKEGDVELELDKRCWSIRPKMPALCAWEAAVNRNEQASLAAAARATYSRLGSESFWIAATESPQTLLEKFAREVFWFHVKRLGWSRKSILQMRAAGAQYWIQKRVPAQPLSRRGMDWHFDQDVALLEDEGIIALPLLSTVTYFCSGGAPLAVLSKPKLVGGPDGMFVEPIDDALVDASLVYPAWGRHVAFHGKQLHGCLADLEERREERLSVLVNIWLYHEPLDLGQLRPPRRLPPELLCKASSSASFFRPGKAVLPSRVHRSGSQAEQDEQRTIAFGPWQLSGLKLPKGLGEGLWVVRQPRDLSLSLRPKRRAVRKPVKKRPAACSAAERKRQRASK
eukprot:TRINITY_DN47667_c0_g1_i1.p1 TRINITY_DN47667_c0_g1~~TRINITY_DN47667_c0_g1_i1.p1  ORF type:complete len:342 (-),score=64.94 TRINITY_DN47667_c0_g1_i1:37-1062(-)